jgi:ribosomal protein L11 methylase PrmA
MPVAAADFQFVRATGLIQELIDQGSLIDEVQVDPAQFPGFAGDATYVLEHPKLPFISYPYEWPFPALKSAALHHLNIQLQALDKDVTLSDATAYNIQFLGARPVFIDSLSFRKYTEGEFWLGHRQFCEQFLNPLLLRSSIGITHNSWFRGSLEGITAQELSRLLPLRRKFSFNVFVHVIMQARLQSRSGSQGDAEKLLNKRKLSKQAYRQMLSGLKRWIARLEPADTGKTVWEDYAGKNSYQADEEAAKHKFIATFVNSVSPEAVWDIGCNTGEYSKCALEAGASSVIGFDADQGALEIAYSRACSESLSLLPLYLDAANPAPAQGWAQMERKGLDSRNSPDALLALALVHHLAIGRNIPLEKVVEWLVSLAPQGVIEFVEKSDPMVQELLRVREDVFENYSAEFFQAAIKKRAEIFKVEKISASGRQLFWYKRND